MAKTPYEAVTDALHALRDAEAALLNDAAFYGLAVAVEPLVTAMDRVRKDTYKLHVKLNRAPH